MEHKNEFKQQLEKSLDHWKQNGYRGIWLKLSNDNSHLIDIAIKDNEFKYHHAKDDYVMLTKWLPENEDNKLPSFATHYVGVGGLVLSKDKSKLLMI